MTSYTMREGGFPSSWQRAWLWLKSSPLSAGVAKPLLITQRAAGSEGRLPPISVFIRSALLFLAANLQPCFSSLLVLFICSFWGGFGPLSEAYCCVSHKYAPAAQMEWAYVISDQCPWLGEKNLVLIERVRNQWGSVAHQAGKWGTARLLDILVNVIKQSR